MNSAANAQDPRWTALALRDRSQDGLFFYSVATTGVFCRPSCGARTPRPENVAFHKTAADAERAGFRACKRCKPTAPSLAEEHAATVAKLCRFIEGAEKTPTLDELAAESGLSAFHLHRVFKAVTGLTPRGYAAAKRADRVRGLLDGGGSITAAVYDAGYGSAGHFYTESNDVLGMTPKAWRAGGADTSIRFAIGECSLGSILVAASERGICAIALGNDPEVLAEELQDRFPRAELVGDDAAFERLVATVVGFVEARDPSREFPLPLDVRGTAFQQRVWAALIHIPFGQTTTYSDLAKTMGVRGVRAVAKAIGSNGLAVVIPCHRVIRKDGDLAGYRWGVERKKTLLNAEGVESEAAGG